RTGKAQLFDGRSGEPLPDPIAVGYVYILKLNLLITVGGVSWPSCATDRWLLCVTRNGSTVCASLGGGSFR
ncbi:hypothetical protein AB0I95_31545, partial [Micromonospora sp. NPDC049751]|uniref:hypothetical protein n=1 Tax=Micromonospora sp. NPDC049751 TaxID=3154837 RepID=UPI0033DC391F